MVVAVMTYIQSETPPEIMGKVLSVLMVVPFIGQSIGYPLQGRLFYVFTAAPWVVVFVAAAVMLAVAVFAHGYFRKSLPYHSKIRSL